MTTATEESPGDLPLLAYNPALQQALSATKVLVIGCGNPSRTDDGVGLYVLEALLRHFDPLASPADLSDSRCVSYQSSRVSLELMFQQQYDIALVEDVHDVDWLVFVDTHADCHTGKLAVRQAKPSVESSLTSHHVTPGVLLALLKSAYNVQPRALTISVEGNNFDFGDRLSDDVRELADKTVDFLIRWIAHLKGEAQVSRGGTNHA